ncbi:MAG TPA: Tol-Pal system protein TolB [Gammaproteobacteria bacterium]|jgi:TolB protein|nr:Tol-Pal system protein TolB [Gammaproteobacteria bacterium]|tara:strand:+ start:6102 stop:7421 length:1320 start_codon:yes stop_codon:yes gene_type:complete
MRQHFAAGLLLLSLAASSWADLDTIIIDQGVDDPIRIAVVPFALSEDLDSADNLAKLIRFDLARSGQFDPVAPENMLSYPSTQDAVFFRDWRILQTAYLVIGQAQTNALGQIQVSYQLFDVATQSQLQSVSFNIAREQWRDLGHKIADLVYTEVTGVRGAFSTKILYVLAQDIGTQNARYKLQVADVDGERARTLFDSSEPILSASWSPDGRRVAYVSFETGRPSIILQDIDGPNREQLTNFRGINGSPVFSPDGKQLAMVLSRSGDPEVFVMDLETRKLRRITRHPAIDTEPSWSPDGRYLVFTSDRGGKPQIYQLELATNFLERLTFVGDYNARARLLPDGRHLVFVHRRNGIFHIAWQDLLEDRLLVLTESSLDESPSLAPNGAMLIYATQDQDKGILAVVSVDGRVKYRLPSSSGDVREPAWSPFLPDVVPPQRG